MCVYIYIDIFFIDTCIYFLLNCHKILPIIPIIFLNVYHGIKVRDYLLRLLIKLGSWNFH